MSKYERYKRNLPKIFKVGSNPIITGLLKAWGQTDDEITTQIQNAKEQLFVRTAEGGYLTKLASGVGVTKPNDLGLLDSEFQELIPNLSFNPKQVRKVFYDVMRVLYGDLYQKANVTSLNYSPFNVDTGEVFEVSIDGQAVESIEILDGDIAVEGAATATELIAVLNRIESLTASIVEVDNNEYINIRTNTAGARGSVEIQASSSMLDPFKLNFSYKKYRITDLAERTVIYQVRPKELIIELPAAVPVYRSGLKGSHHFHADETLESPVAPDNGVWQGSFLFEPGGEAFSVTGNTCLLGQNILKGSVQTTITVSGADDFPDEEGYLIFDWGSSNEEQPVKYLKCPNSNTLTLDPSYIFQKTHTSSARINLLNSELKAYTPRTNGSDYAVYMADPNSARAIVEEMLANLAAAGVVVNFVVLLPEFKYLTLNPYEIAGE